MDYKVGDTLCGCKLLRQCGEGAYGTVFLAEDSIGNKVAVKIIRKSGRISDRELAGLTNYSKCCNHRNLLKIGPISSDETSYFYTMDAADDLNGGNGEYLPDTLANRLYKFKRLDARDVFAMLEGLLAGLEELHSKGLVHRDIKPDNILWVKGCPTLADVGLITQEGEGTIIGTPGFMSEELFKGKRKAEASDDFYALAKVIYCALTGNPVEEYANFPKDMTISLDANLGRAYREPCKRPIRSSAEFRELLKDQPSSEAQQSPEPESKQTQVPESRIIEIHNRSKAWIFVSALAIILLGIILLLWNSRRAERPSVPENQIVKPASLQPGVIVESNGNTHLKKTGLQDSGYAADQQKRVQTFLDGIGYFKKNCLNSLLNYHPMNSAEIMERLNYSNETPRLIPSGAPRRVSKISTPAENALLLLFAESTYPNMDNGKLRKRQAYWRKQSGAPLAVQQKMLKTDPIMQAVAIDLFIRNAVNTLLNRNSFNAEDEKHLKTILSMRQELLDPEFGQLLYLNRKNNP